MISWKQDVLLALVLLILSGIFYFTSLEYPHDVALFPSYLAPILGVLSILLLFSALRQRLKQQGEAFLWRRYIKIASTVILIFAYAFTITYIGYMSASILLIGIFFLCMQYTHIRNAICIAIGSAVLTYTLFAIVLDVPLPTGFLFTQE